MEGPKQIKDQMDKEMENIIMEKGRIPSFVRVSK